MGALALVLAAAGCARTIAGTHVELVDEGGSRTYVSGGAGSALSNRAACELAVSQAVAAIALRFSQENHGLGNDIAKEAGLEDGDSLLQRYAKSEALSARVVDTQFNPADHVCTALVRWKPPVFIKDGLQKYVASLRQRELGSEPAPASAPVPAN